MAESIIRTQLVLEQDDQQPVEILASHTGLSKQRIKLAMQNGAVWWARNGKPKRLRRASRRLQRGDELFLNYNAAILDALPLTAQLIADETSYSVWFKPSGMPAQGSKWGDHCAINRWVEKNLTPQRSAFIVHRLDRAASGLILIAHQKHTAANLAEQFQLRKVSKRYRVIVHGLLGLTEEEITLNKALDGRDAISHVVPITQDIKTNRTLLDVTIETGRKHQIRRHLSDIGYPVIGDRLYGPSESDENLQLMASYIEFTCPDQGIQKHFCMDEQRLPSL